MNFLKKAVDKTKAKIETHAGPIMGRSKSSFKSNTFQGPILLSFLGP
jgi:hypothetical protein